MLKSLQFPFGGNFGKRLCLPTASIPLDTIQTRGSQNEKPSIDRPSIPWGFFGKANNLIPLHPKSPISPRRLHRSDGCLFPVLFMKSNLSRNVDVGDSIPIGKTEICFPMKVLLNPF
jgi:hypothetical protein